MNLSRFENLIGEENLSKIKKLKILILGLGGVGSTVIETLVRCGVNNITLVDSEQITPSNASTQFIVTNKNIKKYKTKEWKKRIKLINSDAIVNIINTHITENNIECIFSNYDYIIDTSSSVMIKSKLINECYKRNIKLIMSFDVANRIDLSKVRLDKLTNLESHSLTKKIRRELSKEKESMDNVIAVVSEEKAINPNAIASSIIVENTAGCLISNYIIKNTLEN